MRNNWPFGDLKPNGYAAIYCDPPWHFEVWEDKETGQITETSTRRAEKYYSTMTIPELEALPVGLLAVENCVLFIWVTWPLLDRALKVMSAWGFAYKTCGFAWVKADVRQNTFFEEETRGQMGCGYWTRANSEVCLLATRGHPKRLHANVRQEIIEPRREHSRKPDCVYSRIERLVAGPYCELFARTKRPGWDAWGNETERFRSRT